MTHNDLLQLEQRFIHYTRPFLELKGQDPRPYLVKEEHTQNVRKNIRLLCEGLSMDEGRTWVAEAVALFHDIGRFPQYREYGTFRDKESVNHAALSAKILLDEGLLAGLPEPEQQVIMHAVTLHNVLNVPAGLSGDDLLFTRLIRDADKLDIWRVFVEYYRMPEADRSDVVGLSLPETAVCTPAVLDALTRGEMVRHDMISSQNDFKLLQLSWVFDLNFPTSFQLMSKRRYVEQLAAMLPKGGDVERAVDSVQKYVERKKK